MSENAQKIYFECPTVKMSKFIKNNQTIGKFKLQGLKNQFSENLQTCIMLYGPDN